MQVIPVGKWHQVGQTYSFSHRQCGTRRIWGAKETKLAPKGKEREGAGPHTLSFSCETLQLDKSHLPSLEGSEERSEMSSSEEVHSHGYTRNSKEALLPNIVQMHRHASLAQKPRIR